jgi:hypothetical protein
VRAALASTDDLGTLLPFHHRDAAVRDFLQQLLPRLQ